MSTSSPMKPIRQGKRLKLYRAEKGVHVYPGIHMWAGQKRGHIRIWPLPPKVIR